MGTDGVLAKRGQELGRRHAVQVHLVDFLDLCSSDFKDPFFSKVVNRLEPGTAVNNVQSPKLLWSRTNFSR